MGKTKFFWLPVRCFLCLQFTESHGDIFLAWTCLGSSHLFFPQPLESAHLCILTNFSFQLFLKYAFSSFRYRESLHFLCCLIFHIFTLCSYCVSSSAFIFLIILKFFVHPLNLPFKKQHFIIS